MSAYASFPDTEFPVAAEFLDEYSERVALGRGRMADKTAVICGLARNIDWVLPETIARMERLGEMFRDVRYVIYENDSIDQTKSLLTAWSERNSKVNVTLERLGDPVNPASRCLKRAERMAKYRNACLAKVRECYSDFDYAIVVDMDLEFGWSYDGVANTFGHDGWDFVGSNGIIYRRCGFTMNTPLQYDAWAFRLDEKFTPLTTAEVNYMTWQRGEPMIPVTSSFGGLGVYRMPAFLAGAYAGHDVDHVTHQQLAQARGFTNVFLNPSQITFYGRHRRRSDLWMIPLLNVATGVLQVTLSPSTQWRPRRAA